MSVPSQQDADDVALILANSYRNNNLFCLIGAFGVTIFVLICISSFIFNFTFV